MQGNMAKAQRYRASKQQYVSPSQLTIQGFETPFSRKLRSDNRWVVLANKIPWDSLVNIYQSQMGNERTGAGGINPRVALGAIIIKHMCDLSDRETVQQIQENMYMQYFIGYGSFSDEEPFDPSLLVDIRKRLGIEQINAINEQILGLSTRVTDRSPSENEKEDTNMGEDAPEAVDEQSSTGQIDNEGRLLMDATACPQDIAYPTDLNLLNDAREKSEELIDELYDPARHEKKPRTYRQVARKRYLKTAQKKVKPKKEIRRALRGQLSYLKRNLKSIYNLLDTYEQIPLGKKQYKYLLVIQTLYDQQREMFAHHKKSIEDRIVSIHQPHVRPIVRGKTNARVEFGAKIQVSMMNGYAFLDELNWNAFNEGARLIDSVEKYKARLGYYPREVLADKIYCTRDNRRYLKERHIKLRAKPLGRPKAVDVEHVRPGERNPIEGKFGQAKVAYGMNRIKARLNRTSESWIASIILVLNLVKLAGQVPLALLNIAVTFPARCIEFLVKEFSLARSRYTKFELYQYG